MEQLNPRDRAYAAGFRAGYQRAMDELRGEVKETQARLEESTERLHAKCDRVDAIANFNMTKLRQKASELAYEIAGEITNKMWADLNAELNDLRAEVAHLRAGDSSAGGTVETECDPETRLN